MSLSPLNINVLGQFLNNTGLTINEAMTAYQGTSTGPNDYQPGMTVENTSLTWLTRAINTAYHKIGNGSNQIPQSIYNRLTSLAQTTCPVLGLCKPTTYTREYTPLIASHGFLRLFPYQAYEEFHLSGGNYVDFVQSFLTASGVAKESNQTIASLSAADSYLLGSYSTMNDLITGDISGVSLSMTVWGTDLIASGKVIDLQNIDKFGNPDVLLRTIYNKRAMTPALNLALLSTGISTTDILAIMSGEPATESQQRLLYAAFCIIVQKDLEDILIPLNCQTPGLFTLADLLDPKKLFPNSYDTLTYPVYNGVTDNKPTNSKTYYLIYKDGAVANIDTFNLGAPLKGYLPEDIAFACAAFRMTMLQIKHIQSMDIEKFSQVVTHLEPISDLANIGGTNVPTDITSAQMALDSLVTGSNADKTINMCDFFGCMTDMHYDWYKLENLLMAVDTPGLTIIYEDIFQVCNGEINTNLITTLTSYLDQADTELANIIAAHPTEIEQLNKLYNEFGRLLNIEQDVREHYLGTVDNIVGNSTTLKVFLQTISSIAEATEDKGPAVVLENIADKTNIGGTSLIASMREARNALRLGYTGAQLHNTVNNDELVLAPITGTPSELGIPIITGAAVVPGSLAGSPYTTLIPPNLSIFNTPSNLESVITREKAITQIITCNCDCWVTPQ